MQYLKSLRKEALTECIDTYILIAVYLRSPPYRMHILGCSFLQVAASRSETVPIWQITASRDATALA